MLFSPGVLEDVMAGEIEGMELTQELSVFVALFWLIPLTMAFLTLILKEKWNRWTNAVLGAFFTVFGIVDMGEHLASGKGVAGYVLISIAMLVVTILIIWHAWKWPMEEVAEY